MDQLRKITCILCDAKLWDGYEMHLISHHKVATNLDYIMNLSYQNVNPSVALSSIMSTPVIKEDKLDGSNDQMMTKLGMSDHFFTTSDQGKKDSSKDQTKAHGHEWIKKEEYDELTDEVPLNPEDNPFLGSVSPMQASNESLDSTPLDLGYENTSEPVCQDSRPLTSSCDERVTKEKPRRRFSKKAYRQWVNGCLFKCMVCDKKDFKSKNNLLAHVVYEHNMSADDYKQTTGATLNESLPDPIYHKCKICKNKTTKNYEHLSVHMASHNLSVIEYYKNYIDNR